MAKQLHDLRSILLLVKHHLEPAKATLLAATGRNTADGLKYRFQMVTDEMTQALGQIDKIRKAAEEGDSKKVIELLDEVSLPGGHDL